GSITDEVSAGHQPDEQADAQNRHSQESHTTAPSRRTARTPPARTRMMTTARPTLRVLDIGVRGRDGRRGHGAEATDLQVHATVELLALLARVVAERRLGADGHDLDRRLRHAQLDEELLDGVRAPLREH